MIVDSYKTDTDAVRFVAFWFSYYQQLCVWFRLVIRPKRIMEILYGAKNGIDAFG